MEFKPFPKIQNVGKLVMHITQKIHGTNAQVFITDEGTEYVDTSKIRNLFSIDDKIYSMFVGSRNKWITPEDNFANFKPNEARKKTIEVLNMKKEIVYTFDSLIAASRHFKINRKYIYKVLNKNETHLNYYWRVRVY